MNKVNLLPDWYLQQQRQVQIMRWRVAMMLGLAVAMFGWTLAEKAHIGVLARQAQALSEPLPIPQNLPGLLIRQEQRILHAKEVQLAYRDVGNTVPTSALIQQILNNLTPGMALSRMTLDVRAEPIKNAAPTTTASAGGTDDSSIRRFHEIAHLTVDGVAPGDVVIAQLIDRLQKNHLITDLSLNFARNELLHGYSVRRFEIQMTIDLDRLSAPPSSSQLVSQPSSLKPSAEDPHVN